MDTYYPLICIGVAAVVVDLITSGGSAGSDIIFISMSLNFSKFLVVGPTLPDCLPRLFPQMAVDLEPPRSSNGFLGLMCSWIARFPCSYLLATSMSLSALPIMAALSVA